jgi:hexosaminidase
MPLLPQPRELRPQPGSYTASAFPAFALDKGLPAQGYRLRVSPERVTIDFADPAGAFYARKTLEQWRRLHGGNLPCVEITDWPDFPSRGVMLDVSRDKVPTLATLFTIVEELAALKINHLELYTEHTFAYRNHRTVWKNASPLTAEDIRALDAFCQARHIQLVPNQNSFGHLERWLRHPEYIGLAEAPNGFKSPWAVHTGPFSLNPLDPGSLALLEELYAELLPNFTSRKFNVGCDETWDLGQGRAAEECKTRGKGRVYLEFLLKIHALAASHGRTMHFWGDIIHDHPELIPELPKDLVALEWGYEGNHPWAERCARFREAGVPFYVCPGTSSWNSLAGRTDNSLANLRGAAEAGLEYGAIGYLNTDWGDNGHWQYWPASLLPIAAGAAFSWNFAGNRDLDLPAALNAHVFRDSAGVLGQLAYRLGNAYLTAQQPHGNASALFRFLQDKPDSEVFYKSTPEALKATLVEIDAAVADLDRAAPARPDAALLKAEFANTAALLRHACHRALAIQNGSDLAVPPDLVQEHRRLWLARNRPGGLEDGIGNLVR